MAENDFLSWDDPEAEALRTLALFDQAELDRHEALDVLADEYPQGVEVLRVIQPRPGITVIVGWPHDDADEAER